jgi:hypothetical protein
MNNYRICIPSFNRPEIIKTKTLKLLEKYNIEFNIIDIFIENEEQFDLYYENLKDNVKYHDLNLIITDTKGIKEKRNFIRNYYYHYEDCEFICSIDDDIDELCIKVDDKKIKPIDNLNEVIINNFVYTKKLNLNIWGVSAYHNPFFLQDKISTNLKYICGAFFGFIVDKKKEILQTNFNHYEDFEFSILHFIRDGGVVRFNNICIITKYFGDGGINESYNGLENRKLDMKKSGEKFVEMYPEYSRLIQKKYGFDIRLKPIKSKNFNL